MAKLSMLYLKVTISNNFVTVRRTLAKFCTQTRVVRDLNMGYPVGEMSLRCRPFEKISLF